MSNSRILTSIGSLTLQYDNMLCLLLSTDWGMVALMITDLLSPNIYALVMMGTPRYLSVFLGSMICSVAVLAATNSEPCVAVSTVACLFQYQLIGVVLMKCNTAVTDFPVTPSWSKLPSKKVVVITLLPSALRMSFGFSSLKFQ